MKDEIAHGYAVAALFTNGIDGHSGEYQPDPDKVNEIIDHAREAAGAFLHLVEPWATIAVKRGVIDPDRIGNCLHYDRDGHGISFTDEGDDQSLVRMAEVAQRMGEDYWLQDQILSHVECDDWEQIL